MIPNTKTFRLIESFYPDTNVLFSEYAEQVPEQEETPDHFTELEAAKELGVATLDRTILNQY